MKIQIKAAFDDEAGVWVATSDDVPGLVAEHAVLSKLWAMVTELVPLLLAENRASGSKVAKSKKVSVHFAAQAERDALVTV